MKRKWYNDGKSEILIRSEQNIPNGFFPGRLKRKPSKLDILSNKYSKELIYELFIIKNISFKDLFEMLNITSEDLRRLLTKYKISKNQKLSSKNNNYKRTREQTKQVAIKSSETQKRKWKEKSEQEKVDWSNKQKLAHNTQHFKNTISTINIEYIKKLKIESKDIYERRNKERSKSCKRYWELNKEYILKKRNETALKNRAQQNKRLCRTIAEQKLYDKLKIKFPDVQYDIRVDERYPFYCDFYIPSLDLFIELQAHPSHGRLPIEYLSIEEYSKYLNKYVDVFAKRDVEKRDYAINNKLNFIRIYPSATIEENININQNYNKDLIEYCYKSQK